MERGREGGKALKKDGERERGREGEYMLFNSLPHLQALHKQKHDAHSSIVKTRRCFHWKGSYFQLDMFRQPSNQRCVLHLGTALNMVGVDNEKAGVPNMQMHDSNNW